MLYLKECWFWLSLSLLPLCALFAAGYLAGQALYSDPFTFESIGQFSIISFCICVAFGFKRSLADAKVRFNF
jgi:hypothetical protein